MRSRRKHFLFLKVITIFLDSLKTYPPPECFLIKSIIFMLIYDFIAKLALAQISTQKVSSLLLDVVLNKIFFCRKK